MPSSFSTSIEFLFTILFVSFQRILLQSILFWFWACNIFLNLTGNANQRISVCFCFKNSLLFPGFSVFVQVLFSSSLSWSFFFFLNLRVSPDIQNPLFPPFMFKSEIVDRLTGSPGHRGRGCCPGSGSMRVDVLIDTNATHKPPPTHHGCSIPPQIFPQLFLRTKAEFGCGNKKKFLDSSPASRPSWSSTSLRLPGHNTYRSEAEHP